MTLEDSPAVINCHMVVYVAIWYGDHITTTTANSSGPGYAGVGGGQWEEQSGDGKKDNPLALAAVVPPPAAQGGPGVGRDGRWLCCWILPGTPQLWTIEVAGPCHEVRAQMFPHLKEAPAAMSAQQ